MANQTDEKPKEVKSSIPKLPPMNFGKKPSMFSGGRSGSPRGQFVPPAIRITQNKGGGGK